MNVAPVDKPVPTLALPYRWIALLAALALLAGAGVLIQAGGALLRDLGMAAVPQRYVALSLPDPTALPVQVEPGAPIAFDFVISNSTPAVVRQRWSADISGPGLADQHIARGSATVGPGANLTVPVHVSMPDTPSEVTIRISAPGQNLAPLEFHVVPAPGSATP